MSFCCQLICWNQELFLYKDLLLGLIMGKLESLITSCYCSEDFGLKKDLNLNEKIKSQKHAHIKNNNNKSMLLQLIQCCE